MFAAPMASQPDLRELLPHVLKVLFYLSPVLYSFEFLQLKMEGTSYVHWLNAYRLLHPLVDSSGRLQDRLVGQRLGAIGHLVEHGRPDGGLLGIGALAAFDSIPASCA